VPALEADLEAARALDVEALADAIESIGFECTDCGACCRSDECDSTETLPTQGSSESGAAHTATVFPDEVRALKSGDDWRDVARPMPFGLDDGEGETFEWALQTDDCGDCTFYDGTSSGGGCTVYDDRPLICETYPFSVALEGSTQPMGDVVERAGDVRAHECEGLGREISSADAATLAATLKRRTIRELEEAIGVQESYEPTSGEPTVVHDSEGQKRPDGTPITDATETG